MTQTIKLFLMILILLGASFQIAFGEDVNRIYTETLEINNIAAESGKSFAAFASIGATAELVGPESDSLLKKYVGARDGYIPASGFTAAGDKLYGHYQSTYKIANKKYVFIKVELEINNTSDSAQTFRLGDITLIAEGIQTNFVGVGPNKLTYMAKDAEDLKSMTDVIYDLEPNDIRRFTYIFVAPRKSQSLALSYQEEESGKLNVKK